MRLSELCIRRPVMTTLLMASRVLRRFFGYRQLPIAAIPRIEVPTITVTVQYPGASPDTMAVSVAAPLERQFAPLPGLARPEPPRAPAGLPQGQSRRLARHLPGADLRYRAIAGDERVRRQGDEP